MKPLTINTTTDTTGTLHIEPDHGTDGLDGLFIDTTTDTSGDVHQLVLTAAEAQQLADYLTGLLNR